MNNGVKFGVLFLVIVALSAGFSSAVSVSSCRNITASGVYTLTQNISSSRTCIIINVSNVVLDCRGYNISYGSYAWGDPHYGVKISSGNYGISLRNVTIDNCGIMTASAAFVAGIFAENLNESKIRNNYVSGRLYSDYIFGAYLHYVRESVIVNNTFSGTYFGLEMSAGDNYQIGGESINNIVMNNNITSFRSRSVSIAGVINSTFSNNIMTSNGSNGGLASGANNTFINNTFICAPGAYGLQIAGGNARGVAGGNMFVNNSVMSRLWIWYDPGKDTFLNNIIEGSVIIAGSSNKTFIGNIISSRSSEALNIGSASGRGSFNNLFVKTTLRTNGDWITTDRYSTGNNFSDTTFDSIGNGSIRILPAVNIPSNSAINLRKLNVTYNRAYLNSTDLSFLNKSAIITLRGLTFPNPWPTMDLNDDGIFENCTAPRCNAISYNSTTGTLVFNVSSFTAYSSHTGETWPAPPAEQPPAEEVPPAEENETEIEEENESISPIMEAGACYKLNETACSLDDGTIASTDIGCPAGESCACVWNSTQGICTLEWGFTDSGSNCDYKCVIQSSEQTECSGGSQILSLIATTIPITAGDDCAVLTLSPEESGCRSSSRTVPCGGPEANLPFFGIGQILLCTFTIALIYLYFKTQ